MKEQTDLSSEHSSELFRNPLEQLLNSRAVANERGRHLESTWWDVANSCFHVVGDPLDKVGAVLVLDVEHLFVHLLHRHTATEHGGDLKKYHIFKKVYFILTQTVAPPRSL